MKKILPLIILFIFSFSAIHAEVKGTLSEDGTLTISGTGDMPDYFSVKAPWYDNREEIKKVVITDGVTNIGRSAFNGCVNLISVTIPNSVASIGDYAFYNCYSLTSIKIPNSVTSIGMYAFYFCTGLTSVEIPNSVTSIGENAFCDCSNLTSVTIGNSVMSIGKQAFDSCSSLTSLEIPNSVTSVGERAFLFCSRFTSITFKGSTPPKFGREVFDIRVYNSIPIYVPANSIEVYKNVLGNNYNIQANPKQLFLDGIIPYTQDSQIDDAEVSFTRIFDGDWEAIYLPFSLKYEDWKDDFEVARINAVRQYDDNNNGQVDRTVLEFVKMTDDESVIYPNTPYLIKAKVAGEKTISVENTTAYKADVNQIECSTTTEKFIFRGNYGRIFNSTIKKKGYYIMEAAQLNNKPLNSLSPYRWYMTRENRNSAYGINNNSTAKEISIRVVGEETTDISQLRITNDELPVYDLNGRRVNENNLKPGMYVKNGRKVIVK